MIPGLIPTLITPGLVKDIVPGLIPGVGPRLVSRILIRGGRGFGSSSTCYAHRAAVIIMVSVVVGAVISGVSLILLNGFKQTIVHKLVQVLLSQVTPGTLGVENVV